MSELRVNSVSEVGGDPVIVSGVLDSGSLPAGSILQVVHASYSTEESTSSTTFVDTSLSASITPSSTLSKIIAQCVVPAQGSRSAANSGGMAHQIERGGSTVAETWFTIFGDGDSDSKLVAGNVSLLGVDSPSTTSPVTYTLQHRMNDGSPALTRSFRAGATGVLVLMEVAG